MDSIWGKLFNSSPKKRAQGVLKSIPMFSDMSGRELSLLQSIMHTRKYQADEVIFNQGAMGAGMYIIVQGSVHIVMEPTGTVLAELGEGDFFGEIALLDESPRSATAVAKSFSIVLGFFQPDLFSLAERNPKLGMKVVMRLARIIGHRLVLSNAQNHTLKMEIEALKTASTQVAQQPQQAEDKRV